MENMKELKIKDLNKTTLSWDLSYEENPFLFVMCEQIVDGWEASTSTNIIEKELLSFVNMTEEDLIVDVADALFEKLNKGDEFYGEVMNFYEREVLELPLQKRRFSSKFKLLETETIEYEGKILYRIQCTQEFECNGLTIYKGQRGGFVENISNIVADGWIFGCAKALNNSKVYGLLKGNSVAKDKSIIDKDAIIDGDCVIKNNATVNGNLHGTITVEGSSIIEESVIIKTSGIGSVNISGKTYMDAVWGNLEVLNNNHTKTQITNTIIDGNYKITNTEIINNSELYYGYSSEITNHNIYNSQIYCDCKSSFEYGEVTKDDLIIKNGEEERSVKETKTCDASISDILLVMNDSLVDKEKIDWRY